MAFNYPYGDTQQLNLNWFLAQWETFREQWATAEEGIDHALDAEIARVEAAMDDLYAARDAAAASKTAAQTAATNAASSKTVATQQATLAQSYANTAQTQAGIATAAAEAAGNSASSASTSATAANLSKTQAANSATAAQTAQTAAEAAETNIVSILTDAIQDAADEAAATATADAEAAADAAEASATAAAGSASDASDSATAAAGSASDAADSATAAAGSATAAAGSATAAAGSASSAADSATAAAASAASIVVDSAMSDSSTNPVQNKVINGELTELKTAFTSSVGGGDVTITPEASAKKDGYYSRNSKYGTLVYAASTAYCSVEPIDISDFKVGTKIKMKASLTSSYGIFITDKNLIVLDYINGSNATDKGYTPGATPQLVELTVPQNAKYITSDQRNTLVTGMSDFAVTGQRKTNIDHNAEDIETTEDLTSVINDALFYDRDYIFPALEVGLISIYTDANNPWVYTNDFKDVRTKQGFTIHLFIGDKIGLTSYADGALYALGWRKNDGTYNRALQLSADYTVTEEGDYVVGIYQNPLQQYYTPYTIGKRLFIKRKEYTEKRYDRIDSVALKGIGHRGYIYEGAPENTIWSFRAAKTKGFPCVETDLAWTSDNVAVLLHDSTINRTARNSDGTEISETININHITYAEALEYDFGIYAGAEYAGTKIMTAEELIIFCRANNMFPYFEIKTGVGFSESNITALVNMIKKYDMLDCVAFISFSYGSLVTTSLVAPEVKLGRNYSGTSDFSGIQNELLILKNPRNTVVLLAYASYLEEHESDVVTFCSAHDIRLGIAMTNDVSFMASANNYITECCSEHYVFGDVIAAREMGTT